MEEEENSRKLTEKILIVINAISSLNYIFISIYNYNVLYEKR